jgi:hypothetical protein
MQEGTQGMQEQIIHIQWEGLFSIKDLHILRNEDTDYGIYQISGCHPVYGSSVLVYIGKAVRQTFGERIFQAGWEDNQDAGRLEIYVGRLAGASTPSDSIWEKEISLAESLLIFAHAPAHNSKSITSIPDKKLRNIHILNWGARRDLMTEVLVPDGLQNMTISLIMPYMVSTNIFSSNKANAPTANSGG